MKSLVGYRVICVQNDLVLIYWHIIDWKCCSKGGDGISSLSTAQEFGVSMLFLVTYLNWAPLFERCEGHVWI